MRSIKTAVLVLLAGVPVGAAARPWQGIQPGATSVQEVVQKFGEPTNRTKRSGRAVLAYYGEQALPGTRQAQFHADAGGVVIEITVFLTAELDAASVEGTYGKPPQKTFVEDTFQKVWLYPQSGVTVYFNKDGNVEALSFTAGKGKAGAGEPKAAPASPQPPAGSQPSQQPAARSAPAQASGRY
jgi:hypothetical protein